MKLDPEILYYCATFAFLPIAIAAAIGIRYFQAKSNEKWMVILVIIACISELISSALWRNRMNNILISHLYTTIEFALLVQYFFSYFQPLLKKLKFAIIIAFLTFIVIKVGILSGPFKMNAWPRTVESIFMIGLSLLTYRFIMRNSGDIDVWKHPLFWINSAVLIYFSSNMLLFYFSSFVATVANGLSGWIWTIHLVFMTLYYSLISIGLWKVHQTRSS